MDKKIKVYMGIPSNGTMVDSQGYVLRELQERYGDKVELVYPPLLVQRIFHDAARNGIVEEFLASGCDVLWFLDSDVTPAKHVLDLITMHWDKWQVAGAAYPIWMGMGVGVDRQVMWTVYNKNENGHYKLTDLPEGGTEFVDGLATGCMFIKREVFEKLKKPYFTFEYHETTRAPIVGEDLGFCMKLNEMGIRFFTDYSMAAKHQKTVCLLEIGNYARNYANSKVLAYDQAIREQVQKLANQNELLKRELAQAKMMLNSQPKSKLILPPGAGSLSSR